MALIIDLKPGEKILIGTAVITNDQQRTRIHIAGDAPILREKDVLQEEEALTPCSQVYFLIQCMYLARNPREYHTKYFALVRQIMDAAPTTTRFFVNINENILIGHYYKALKDARKLMEHEQTLFEASDNAAAAAK